jgi:hypothetical protein
MLIHSSIKLFTFVFMTKKIQLPTDTNKKAKAIVDALTGDKEEISEDDVLIKSAAAAMGRKGGLKGGPARKAALTQEQRINIAKKAAAARWGKS